MYDTDHNVIGISEEGSPFCSGSVTHDFTLDVSEQIFGTMEEFAKYSFNKAHSGCYANLAYKTAWLSYYYPVEWAVACLSTYNDTEKITATLNLCKKRGISVLPPDINKSDDWFAVEALPSGAKAVRYGMKGIKDVGDKAIQFMKDLRSHYGPFMSFGDFYDKCHSTDNVKKFISSNGTKKPSNPVNKRVEVALIESGCFDDFEENRYKLLNHYSAGIRKDKNYVPLDEKDYVRKIKLQYEKDRMGSYVSEHPLDLFPYMDLESAADGDTVETTGIVRKVIVKKTKRGADFSTVLMETKDGKERKIMIFGKKHEKFKPMLKKDAIIVVTGEYNKAYDNINANKVKTVVGKKNLVVESQDGDDGVIDMTDEVSNVMPIFEPQKDPSEFTLEDLDAM